ncbi:SMAD/FHA domain-containing protein [Hypoxylon crocopeplum]|nr:SMAD/FHA domain-containing protein [Hypoxylon crocopeplum]
MGYDESLGERRASRSDGEDAYEHDRRSRTTRNDDSHRHSERRRERSRDRSRERKPRRRSGSPDDARRRRSNSRDRKRHREGRSDHRRRGSRDHDDCSDRGSHRRRARANHYDDVLDNNDDRDRSGNQMVKRSRPLPSQADSFAVTQGEEPPKPKEKPNFGNTGALAAASNSIVQSDGSRIVLKYHEPPEARKASPKDQWKLFVFKGEDIVDTVPLSNRSCWLVGRELAVVDLPAEHPSISKQHAVIQFRYIEKRNEYGDKIGKVKPYLIDLESANGTMLNGKKVLDSRYVELRDKDMMQFGQSTREYVIMLAPKE